MVSYKGSVCHVKVRNPKNIKTRKEAAELFNQPKSSYLNAPKQIMKYDIQSKE